MRRLTPTPLRIVFVSLDRSFDRLASIGEHQHGVAETQRLADGMAARLALANGALGVNVASGRREWALGT